MGQVLHKRATTTHRIRTEIQQSQESISKLAEKYGINPKTVSKWKKRTTAEDAPMGKKVIKSTVLTEIEEEAIIKTRQLSQLALDDLFIVLKDSIPNLSRSSLHRCLKRHGVSQLPKPERTETEKKPFKKYEIGYFHIDTAEIKTAEGKAYLFVAIDRTSKFAVAKLYKDKTQKTSAKFLQLVIGIVPYTIHTILTDNGIEYTDEIHQRTPSGQHPFDRICLDFSIEHRLTKIKHPWTNGQVERMNRTLKEATIKQYHYQSFDELQEHLAAFLAVYNCAKRLKSLKLKTPLEFLNERFLNMPILFKQNPHHYYLGLKSLIH